ncbi:MAG: hypothetical protein F7B59_02640 [Desulfurococcales archaeon]|nr:hypothetical protein [Desulfurococcales archaeon]
MNFKTFAFGLLLVAIIASIYSAPKSLFINMVFEGTPSPYNTNWLGTSDLYHMLVKEGYNVYSPTTWSQLLESIKKSNTTRIILVFISPDHPITTGEAQELYSAIKNREASLLVGDEDTTSNNLLAPIGIRVTGIKLKGPNGSPYDPAILQIPTNAFTTIQMNASKTSNISVAMIKRFTLELSIASNITQSETHPSSFVSGGGEVISYDYMGRVVGIFKEKTKYFSDTAVFGDGTIFLNTALRSSTKQMNYTLFALTVFKALSHGDNPRNVTVIVDSSHYNTIIPNITGNSNITGMADSYFKAPLPIVLHPAMLTYFFLVIEKGVEQELISYLAEMPLLSVPIVGLIAYFAYRILKTGFPYELVDDDKDYTVPEVTVLTQSRYRQTLVSAKKLDKNEIKNALFNLYFTLNEVFKEHMGVTLEEITQDPAKTGAVSRITGIDSKFLLDFSKWMISYRDKYEGKRRFTPLVLRWGNTLGKRAREAEFILEKLGYTLEGRKEGFKGVEYGVRKY